VGVFIAININAIKLRTSYNKNLLIRDMTNFSVEKLVENLTELLQAFSLSTQESVNQAFDKFVNIFM